MFLCVRLVLMGTGSALWRVFINLSGKRKYLTEEELTEMIGLYALVPGPSSSQTITAIGYYIGGPILALFLSLFGHYHDNYHGIIWGVF